jgi:two-component system sensor histidine kinase KdpD
MPEEEIDAQHFLELIRESKRGKLKIYIGMSAGVGKTYRMLQEAHVLLRNGIDVRIGYIETHGRRETEELVKDLPLIPRSKLYYKGKEMEEMDMNEIIKRHPEVVLVDELAHSNVTGSNNEKRWQDVQAILQYGINVISAVNIQHIESLNEEVKHITRVEVSERIPDSLLQLADEVVNIDLPADELISRLKAGYIYTRDKIPLALENFFQPGKILQLRELALREVTKLVERKIESEIPGIARGRPQKLMCCIGSNHEISKNIIRKSARLAIHFNAKWIVLYVQTPKESADKIGLAAQRHLINNFKLATELGAEVKKIKHSHVAGGIIEIAESTEITTICIGKPHLSLTGVILQTATFSQLLKKLGESNIDLLILS